MFWPRLDSKLEAAAADAVLAAAVSVTAGYLLMYMLESLILARFALSHLGHAHDVATETTRRAGRFRGEVYGSVPHACTPAIGRRTVAFFSSFSQPEACPRSDAGRMPPPQELTRLARQGILNLMFDIALSF